MKTFNQLKERTLNVLYQNRRRRIAKMKTINLFVALLLVGLLLALSAGGTIAQGPAPGSLVLWNKLGSDEEVLNSAFGPDLEFYVGGSWPEVQGDREYVPGKYGNGVTLKGIYGVMDRIHNLVLNDLSNVIDPEKGCIELWYYQTAVPVPYSHGIYRLFDGTFGLGSGMGFEVIGADGGKPARVRLYLQFGGPARIIWYDAGNIPTNEWVHLAASWDRSGIGGTSETMRLYVDGEKVAATTENDWGNTVGEKADICGGNDHNIIGKFKMDNLIVWNYAKTDFSDRVYEAPTIVVPIDIKPGSDPNSIDLKSKGVVPVAVLTTDAFDASNVDPDTVKFAGASPKRWTMEDVDGDGDADLLFHFKTQELLDLGEGSTEATLTGYTYDAYGGYRIQGTDTVNIVPKGK